jgi:hypothetical protein
LKWRLKIKKFLEKSEKSNEPTDIKEEFNLTEEQKANLQEQQMQDMINQVLF